MSLVLIESVIINFLNRLFVIHELQGLILTMIFHGRFTRTLFLNFSKVCY